MILRCRPVPAGLTLEQGATAFAEITIIRIDGFPSSVVLGATGLPAGVTATFAPPATTGTDSTLTLTASNTTTPGPAVITVTGTGGGLTRTVNIDLLVTTAPVQDFALAASPTGLGVFQGDTATSTISIIPIDGFTGAVSFAASGLPSGVTATFSPPVTTGPDTLLTLTIASTATVGPATVTVIGTSGALVRTVDVALFVNAAAPQDFFLTASPSGLGLVQGDAATTTNLDRPEQRIRRRRQLRGERASGRRDRDVQPAGDVGTRHAAHPDRHQHGHGGPRHGDDHRNQRRAGADRRRRRCSSIRLCPLPAPERARSRIAGSDVVLLAPADEAAVRANATREARAHADVEEPNPATGTWSILPRQNIPADDAIIGPDATGAVVSGAHRLERFGGGTERKLVHGGAVLPGPAQAHHLVVAAQPAGEPPAPARSRIPTH